MIAAALVLTIAFSDAGSWCIARFTRQGQRAVRSVLVFLAGWAVVAAVAGASAFGPFGLLLGVVGFAWPLVTARFPAAAVAFAVLVAAAVFLQPLLPGFMLGGTPIPLGAAGSTSLRWLATLGAVVLFLGPSANLLCRSALERARATEQRAFLTASAATDDAAAHGWDSWLEALRRRIAVPIRKPQEMRGGRIIGPLERWILLGLALSGAQPVIAALVAAKGIVRFPEINKNSGEGSKAEEFLVGSLLSWGIAGAGALLVAVSA